MPTKLQPDGYFEACNPGLLGAKMHWVVTLIASGLVVVEVLHFIIAPACHLMPISLQTTHQDALACLQGELQQAKAAEEAVDEQLAASQAALVDAQQQLQQQQENIKGLESQLSE